MVFHWSLNDRNSPQVSGTLLSILAVLNSAVDWMVSTCLQTPKSSSPFNNLFVTVPKAPIMIGTNFTFMFHSFFNSLARLRYLSFFLHSFSFILFYSTILTILFFFCWLLLGLVFWLRLGDPFVCQIPLEFVCIIFQDSCWVGHIPFICMLKFKFFAPFPVDYLAHPVVSSLILLCCIIVILLSSYSFSSSSSRTILHRMSFPHQQ